MDRQVEFPNQILTDVELLTIQRNALVAIGWLSQSVLGTSATAIGLACTATSPATMTVQVGIGAIYSQQSLDVTPYGSLAADTSANHQIVKQGLNLSTQTLSCPAPTTAGQSVVYLVQAEYQDFDTNSTVLQYFNPANPSVAFTGQNNTGAAQNTTRQGLCAIAVKAGVAATTGSQTAPAADTGYSPLYTVTVAYGQTTITAGNIAIASGSPFLPLTLPAVGSAVLALQNAITVPNVQVFSANGTFTVPANCTAVDVELWGAGGGAGGSYVTNYVGAGGGAGGYGRGRYTVTPGAAIAVTVGTGGAAGQVSVSASSGGGSSSFGSFLSATGGGGGGNAGAGSNGTPAGGGGTATGGYLGFAGSAGSTGFAGSGGFGGAAFQGSPSGPNLLTGSVLAFPGSGGSAGGPGNLSSGGQAGIVIVRHLP